MRQTIRRHRPLGFVAAALLALTLFSAGGVQVLRAQDQRFNEETVVSIVAVDVVVRDASGNIVKGLTAKDFTVQEEGKPQKIETFDFFEIAGDKAEPIEASLLEGVQDKLRANAQRAASAQADPATVTAATAPPSLSNRRMWVLMFDISSMQPEDIQRAVDGAQEYVDSEMTTADMIAVVTISSTTGLNVLTDFTSVREDVMGSLQRLAYSNGTDVDFGAVETAATDEAAAAATETTTEDAAFADFNNDIRLRAIKTLCDSISHIQQKKALLYYSSGMSRSGNDNAIEQRAAENSCNRANASIYAQDSRGLQAVVASGGASQRSQGGQNLFNGEGAQRGLRQLTQSQDSMATLAAATGGRSFTGSNSFSEAFERVQNDIAAYYLIGYSSTNSARDGKFRRISVRVNRPDLRGLRVDARPGYYAGRSFANTNRRDREAQLSDQMAAAVSSTDVPMVVGTGYFRQTGDRFYIPIAMAVPGFAVPVSEGSKVVLIDVRGEVRDEQNRAVATIKDTLEVPANGGDTLAGRQVFYQSGVTLPPGQFYVKMVVRENTGGGVGSFEAPINVPQLRDDSMKVSSVVMSTQVQKTTAKADNPLVRDGVQLLPNLTRVVGRNQNVYFYYEVYDPSLAEQAPQIRTSMAFYRGGVKVFETPLVERTAIDEPNRKAVVFQFEVPASQIGQLKPGTYTCQINIIDTVANKISFPRVNFTVME